LNLEDKPLQLKVGQLCYVLKLNWNHIGWSKDGYDLEHDEPSFRFIKRVNTLKELIMDFSLHDTQVFCKACVTYLKEEIIEDVACTINKWGWIWRKEMSHCDIQKSFGIGFTKGI